LTALRAGHTIEGARVRIQGVIAMIWEAPSFEEVKMDAEVNSYQDDLS
jgi:coenzyme PQQ precursor peptide PqqA